jgi:hypothetical protein
MLKRHALEGAYIPRCSLGAHVGTAHRKSPPWGHPACFVQSSSDPGFGHNVYEDFIVSVIPKDVGVLADLATQVALLE